MLDKICLIIGRVVLFGSGSLIILFLLGGILYLSWKHFFQYLFYKFKHLFPRWQPTQKYINECREIIKNADSTNWRKNVTIKQKGRFVKWHCPTSHFGGRTEYFLIKK